MASARHIPRFIEPALPTLVDRPPEGDGWFHEIKYDGYRTQIVTDGKVARAFTRNGHDWTSKYPAIIAASTPLIARRCCIDGEAAVPDASGRASFNAIQRALKWSSNNIILFAFDLLAIDGRDLRNLPCQERRQMLADLLGDPDPFSALQRSESFEGSGLEFFRAVEAIGLQGIVSKRKDSPYRGGRTRQWQKCKAYDQAAFVVVGYERTSKSVPSLLLARLGEAGLAFAGRAMPALTQRRRDELWARLEQLHADAFAVAGIFVRDGVPVRPEIQVIARFLRGEQKLRHATVVQIK